METLNGLETSDWILISFNQIGQSAFTISEEGNKVYDSIKGSHTLLMISKEKWQELEKDGFKINLIDSQSTFQRRRAPKPMQTDKCKANNPNFILVGEKGDAKRKRIKSPTQTNPENLKKQKNGQPP